MAPPSTAETVQHEASSSLASLLHSERLYLCAVNRLREQRQQLVWKSRNRSDSSQKRGSIRRGSVSEIPATAEAAMAAASGSPMTTPSKMGRRPHRPGRRPC